MNPLKYRAQPVDRGESLGFAVYAYGAAQPLFTAVTAFGERYGDCSLSPDQHLLLVHSCRRFLGDTDHQIDFFDLSTGKCLFGLYDVAPTDLRFSPDGAHLYQRQRYAHPRDNRILCLSPVTGSIQSTQPYDEVLFEAGLPALLMT